ncbi:MAG: hypothetical protein EA357_08375 [Micavibrio sp.]|nr:MAG: hypothetical protein EA357_08375 [Micavibrio sp.]
MLFAPSAEAQNLYLRNNPSDGAQNEPVQQSGTEKLFLAPQNQPSRNRNLGAGAALFTQPQTQQRPRQSAAARQQQQYNMIDEYQRLNIENAQRIAEEQSAYVSRMSEQWERDRLAYHASIDAQAAAQSEMAQGRASAAAAQEGQSAPSRQRLQQQTQQGSGLQKPPRIFNILD